METNTAPRNAKPNGKTTTKLIVEERSSEYGIPRPTITIVRDRKVAAPHYRIMNSQLHRLAAAIEEYTPAKRTWCVQVDVHRDAVYLELGEGEADEVADGMRLLRIVAKAAGIA
jgi:hypothetical protein